MGLKLKITLLTLAAVLLANGVAMIVAHTISHLRVLNKDLFAVYQE